MTIIEALQRNEMAFGLMHTDKYTNEEMVAKAREIGKDNFEWYGAGWNTLSACSCFNDDNTYRLRENYTEPEAGVEKCEVKPKYGVLRYKRNDCYRELRVAVDCPDFIGYLYEDGFARVTPRIYQLNSGMFMAGFDAKDIISGTAKVLTPTDVLFRK